MSRANNGTRCVNSASALKVLTDDYFHSLQYIHATSKHADISYIYLYIVHIVNDQPSIIDGLA